MQTKAQLEHAISKYEGRPADGEQRFWISANAFVEDWPDSDFFYWHAGDGVTYKLRADCAEQAAAAGLPEITDIVFTGMPQSTTQSHLDHNYVADAVIFALVDAESQDAALAKAQAVFPGMRLRFCDSSYPRTLDDVTQDSRFAHPRRMLGLTASQPRYKREFPDFDAEIPQVPGMTDASWRNEGMPMFLNELAGLRLWVDYADPALCHEGIGEARLVGEAKRFSLCRVVDAEDMGKDVGIFETDDWDEAMDAYAREWLAKVSLEIGPGFHPDTSVENYEPALPANLAAQYEAMLDLVFKRFEDPYGVCIEVFEQAGLYPSQAPAA